MDNDLPEQDGRYSHKGPVRLSPTDMAVESGNKHSDNRRILTIERNCDSGSGITVLVRLQLMFYLAAIDSVLGNYPALLEALEIIGNESHDDYGRRANGILVQLERFIFGLKLSHLVFSATEDYSSRNCSGC